MAWVRIDDEMPNHPKVAVLSDEALCLYVRALCYSSKHGLDGRIPKKSLRHLCPSRKRSAIVEELADDPPEGYEAPLWLDKGDYFEIHDYLEYNPSTAERQEKRRQTRERVRKHRRKKRNAVTNTDRNAVTNADVTPLVTPPTPYPNRKKTSSSPEGGEEPSKKLTPQQLAVGRVLGLYEEYELAPPPASLVAKWIGLCSGDAPALLARLEEILLSGRLQAVDDPTAFGAKVVQNLARQLRTGERPPRARVFENGAGPDRPSAADSSLLRSILSRMRAVVDAGDQGAKDDREDLRRLYDQAGWEWAEPTPELVELLSAKLYPQGGAG